MTTTQKTIRNYGLFIGIALLILTYLSTQFYTEENIESAFFIDISIRLIVVALIVTLYIRQENEFDSFKSVLHSFSFKKLDLLFLFLLSFFVDGVLIAQNLVFAYLKKPFSIDAFYEYNNYLLSNVDIKFCIYSIFQILIYIIIFQGLILKGLLRYVSFFKANLLTALLFGLLAQYNIGCVVYCLFLNQMFQRTNSILYVISISIAFKVIQIFMELYFQDLLILSTDFNKETYRSIIYISVPLIVVIKVLNNTFKKVNLLSATTK
jgi:membrane protease YdiL (CAAX protease family)